MSIYKACDIRGNVSLLSDTLYRQWGEALGRRLTSNALFVVGGDVRPSTPAFLDALADGLLAAGMRVVDLGIVPTPLVYFAQRRLQAAGCAIVTASHNPPHINGLKWMVNNLPANEDDVAALRRDAESLQASGTPRPTGTRLGYDATDDYRQWLQAQVSGAPKPSMGTVILDPGNGCWSGRALAMLQALFPSLQWSAIHDRADGRFPDRNPDCSRPEYLHALCAEVRAAGATLGIAFDGDGDRVAFVDGDGHALSAEETTWILLHSFSETIAGRAFVYDLKLSERLAAEARCLGGLPCMERSGHAFIRRRMQEEGALFGAEISGHYFYELLGHGDDGLYSAARMVAYLAAMRLPLAALRRSCPPIFLTPDLRIACSPEKQQAVLAAAKAAFADHPLSFVDGVRISLPHGWALARSSVTEAALTLRFEGDSSTALAEIVEEFSRRVPTIGPALRDAFHQAMRPHAE